MTLFRRCSVLVLLITLGCSAQSNQASSAGSGSPTGDAKVNRLIENHVRGMLPPQVAAQAPIEVGKRGASDIPGYDTVPVTLGKGERAQTVNFLLSKDGKTLAQLSKFDLKDPMAKMDLAGRPVRGNKDAKVSVVVYDDFQCPYCTRLHETIRTDVMKNYGDKVKIVYRDYPLEQIHPWAVHAAVNANCLGAKNSNAYWDYADWVHGNLRQVSEGQDVAASKKRLDDAARLQATKHNLPAAEVNACISKQDETAVRASMKEGDGLGVNSTPIVFVNGEKVGGALPFEDFRAVLDRALLAEGVPVPEIKPDAPSSAKADAAVR